MSSKNHNYQIHHVAYATLPPIPTTQNVVVLPIYQPPPSRHRSRHYLVYATATILLFLTIFLLYPSDPTIQLALVRLNSVRVNSSPGLTLDLSFSLTVKVYNRNFFSLDYNSLVVAVGYRGRELGFVSSQGGRVGARSPSYVNATVDLNGFEVIHDVFYLLQDLARGVIPFDTDTEVNGAIGLLFFKIPLKARVSCEVHVNTNDQTIVHQDCYPE
ncbi:hypothetical protein I3842_03G221200 [Carya illinoinensis]|uniref:Late embryogenesis abundant protein LEA-2 subgroup domain-containing protein n=1 Tax=Carya illinoinensis TaxID=32201 RepID=A0A922K049_CARIL|nr:hypothetical protein I3842_03G221200 [Carya illinoinensis]